MRGAGALGFSVTVSQSYSSMKSSSPETFVQDKAVGAMTPIRSFKRFSVATFFQHTDLLKRTDARVHRDMFSPPSSNPPKMKSFPSANENP